MDIITIIYQRNSQLDELNTTQHELTIQRQGMLADSQYFADLRDRLEDFNTKHNDYLRSMSQTEQSSLNVVELAKSFFRTDYASIQMHEALLNRSAKSLHETMKHIALELPVREQVPVREQNWIQELGALY